MKILSKSNDAYILPAYKRSDNHFREKKYQELYDFLTKYENKSKSCLLSIILPMFNEENTIGTILEDLPEHKLIEIIVIDDCSTDHSVHEVKRVKSQRRIRLICHKKNAG